MRQFLRLTRLAAALILTLGPVAPRVTGAAERDPPKVTLIRGNSATYILSGPQHKRLTAVRVLHGARSAKPTRAVSASLGRVSRKGRVLILTAAGDAPLGSAYGLQGWIDRKMVGLLALQVEVVAARRPDSGKSAPLTTAPKKTIRPTKAVLRLGKGAMRSVTLESPRFKRLKRVRVVYKGKVVDDVQVTVTTTRRGTSLYLSSTSTMQLTSGYSFQGYLNRAWIELPIVLTTTLKPELAVEAKPRLERITLPDGTVLVIGPEEPMDIPGASLMPPEINGWSPRNSGLVGSVLSIQGARLPLDALARIGDVQLVLLSATTSELKYRLPASSEECPIATLRLYYATGAPVFYPGWRDFFVKGDKPFHHFEHGETVHRWINSYLLALMSLYSYEAEVGASGWSTFKSQFRAKAKTLGLDECRFARDASLAMDTQVAIAANPEVIVVAFRGSETNAQDWLLTDVKMIKKPKNNWKEGCWVHSGFYYAYDRLHTQVKAHIGALRTREQKIFITGHSLGGALSTMCAYRLKRAGVPIQGVCSFASPRVGNDQWRATYNARGLGARTQRWCNKRDLVTGLPGLPSPGWVHVGKTNNIYENHQIKLDDDEFTSFGANVYSNHSMTDYAAEIYADLKSRTDDEDKVPAWK